MKIHYVISPELIRISNPKNIIDARIDPLSEVMYTQQWTVSFAYNILVYSIVQIWQQDLI